MSQPSVTQPYPPMGVTVDTAVVCACSQNKTIERVMIVRRNGWAGQQRQMDIYTVIGLAGVAGYVASYGLLQLGFLDGNGVRYSVANVTAAALVLVSLMKDFNLASAVIQVTWIAIGVVGLALRLLQGRSAAAAAAAPAVAPAPARLVVAEDELSRDVEQHSVVKPSPFRIASHTAGRTFDLRPDTVEPHTGRTTLGLRADTVRTSSAS